MRELPEVESDLLALYHFDISAVFRGEASAHHALILAERLPYEPMSLARAELLGSTRWMGYDLINAHVQNTTDAVREHTWSMARMLGHNRWPQPVLETRPDTPSPTTPVVPTLAELTPAMIGL